MLKITHIGDVEVLIQQPAYGPHPHPDFQGQMFAYSGVLHIQLADGREGYIGEICPTVDCDKVWDSCKSAAAHLSAHNGKDRASTIPVETLKQLLRLAKRFRANGNLHNYAKRTADELNRLGVPTNDGEAWNAERVARLFNKWQDKVKAPLPPSRPEVKTTDIVPTQRGKSLPANRRESVVAEQQVEESSIVSRVIAMGDQLHEMSAAFERLASEVAAELAKGKVDPAIVRKARLWDTIDKAVFDKAKKWDDAVRDGVIEKAAKFDAARNQFGGNAE